MAATGHVIVIIVMACFIITTGVASLKCYECISENMNKDDDCNANNVDMEESCSVKDIKDQLVAYDASNRVNMTKEIEAITKDDFHCIKIVINNKFKDDKYVIRTCSVRHVGAVMFCDIVKEILPTSNLTDAPGKVEECAVCNSNLCNVAIRLTTLNFFMIYSTPFFIYLVPIIFKSVM